MEIYKTKTFARWAADEGVDDEALRKSIEELEQGLSDGNLGGNVYKKRVALDGRGKRSGSRTIIAFRASKRAFFLYGFAKNERDNISPSELKLLKALAKDQMNASDDAIARAIESGDLIKVEKKEQEHEKQTSE